MLEFRVSCDPEICLGQGVRITDWVFRKPPRRSKYLTQRTVLRANPDVVYGPASGFLEVELDVYGPASVLHRNREILKGQQNVRHAPKHQILVGPDFQPVGPGNAVAQP